MKRSRFLTLVAVAALFLGSLIFPNSEPVQAGTSSWRTKISPDLLASAEGGFLLDGLNVNQRQFNGDQIGIASDNQSVDVIIKLNRKVKKTELSGEHELARSAGGFLKKGLGVINSVAARVPLSSIEELSKRDDVVYISPDRPVVRFGHLETTTGTAQARSLISPLTLDGSNIGIAFLDSGIDGDHHSFEQTFGSRIAANVHVSRFPNADDYSGHGTHVASVAVGNNHIGPGAYTGIAPDAKIINVKVLDRDGVGYSSDIIDGINWCISNRSRYNIRILNLSLGAPAIDSYRNDPLCQAVRAAHNAGLVVVVAAGNDGKDKNGNKIYGALHSPGVEPSAITVGASNTKGTDSRVDDGVCTFSSRGPTRGSTVNSSGQRVYDNLIKPDLVAPGNKIISAQAFGSDLVERYPQLDANRFEWLTHHYVMYMSGSSVAAPAVSGAAALLLEANPSLTPSLVKAILMYSAQPLKGYNLLEQGAGQLNIDGAIRIAKVIKNPVTGLSNGQSMLAASLPSQQSTIAGKTFSWGQGLITDHTFVHGSGLMTYWQGMYASGVILADGTLLASNQLIKAPGFISSSPMLGNGVVLVDGTLLASGTLVVNGSGTLLAGGTLLAEGVILADSRVTSDGTLLAEGTLLSEGVALYETDGDPTSGMVPLRDNTTD